jgi:two-component SAPR family response regulator
LYTGDFLEKNGYLWAHSDCNFYRTKFNSAALALSKYYFMKRNYNAAKRVLLKILEVDYSDECTHELLLQVYLQDNDYISFLRHYNELKNYLQRELQITPKTTIQNLYNRFYPVAMKITEEKTSFF